MQARPEVSACGDAQLCCCVHHLGTHRRHQVPYLAASGAPCSPCWHSDSYEAWVDPTCTPSTASSRQSQAVRNGAGPRSKLLLATLVAGLDDLHSRHSAGEASSFRPGSASLLLSHYHVISYMHVEADMHVEFILGSPYVPGYQKYECVRCLSSGRHAQTRMMSAVSCWDRGFPVP